MVLHEFSDYPLKDVRNFAAGGGHSLLWPEATIFLSHREPIRGRRPPQLLVAEGHKDL